MVPGQLSRVPAGTAPKAAAQDENIPQALVFQKYKASPPPVLPPLDRD